MFTRFAVVRGVEGPRTRVTLPVLASVGVFCAVLEITPNAAEPLANVITLSVARKDAVAVGEYSRRLLKLDPYSKAALQGWRRRQYGPEITQPRSSIVPAF
jgi:hypothetical protein